MWCRVDVALEQIISGIRRRKVVAPFTDVVLCCSRGDVSLGDLLGTIVPVVGIAFFPWSSQGALVLGGFRRFFAAAIACSGGVLSCSAWLACTPAAHGLAGMASLPCAAGGLFHLFSAHVALDRQRFRGVCRAEELS